MAYNFQLENLKIKTKEWDWAGMPIPLGRKLGFFTPLELWSSDHIKNYVVWEKTNEDGSKVLIFEEQVKTLTDNVFEGVGVLIVLWFGFFGFFGMYQAICLLDWL